MKCAAILSVAVVMMMGQGAESLLGGLLSGGASAAGNVVADVQANLFASLNANAIASLDAAIEVGAIARAQVLSILGIDVSLFNDLWVLVDANVNERLDLDELIDLELMIYVEGLLDIDVDLDADVSIGIDINLTGASRAQCNNYLSAWRNRALATKRNLFAQFFRKREQLKRRLRRFSNGGRVRGRGRARGETEGKILL